MNENEKKTLTNIIYKKKTRSDIPKTSREKEMWIQSRRIVAKMAGKPETGVKESDLTSGQWGLVTTIYKDAVKAGKIPRQKDWENRKSSKAVKRYK